jgi:hypothetical protein
VVVDEVHRKTHLSGSWDTEVLVGVADVFFGLKFMKRVFSPCAFRFKYKALPHAL